MSRIKIDKVVSVLPDPLVPNTFYAVRVGEGFDLFFSDTLGLTAHPLNAGGGDFPTVEDAVNISGGLDGALESTLLAQAGRSGATEHVIQAAANTPCYIACIKTGLLFINGVYIQDMESQEIYIYNAQQGDKILLLDGSCFPIYRRNNNLPFEANNPSQAGKEFFWNHFRSSPTQDYITPLLPVVTNIRIWGPNPTFVNGVISGTPQVDLDIPVGTTANPTVTGTGEFYMLADLDVMLTTTNGNSGIDSRTVPPPSKKLIGCIRSGGGNNFSSLRDNNTATIHTRNGAIGTFTASPGQPAKLDVASSYDTNTTPTNTQLNRDSIGIFNGQGEGNLYQGADGAGTNATQWISTKFLSNEFVIPLDIQVRTFNRDRSVIMGESECEVYVYDPDGSYRGRIDVRRSNTNGSASPATTPEHQLFPASENFNPDQGLFLGQGTLPRGTKFLSNMLIGMICNFTQSQDVMAADDETIVFGDLNRDALCDTRINPITGMRERERLNDAGTAREWVTA